MPFPGKGEQGMDDRDVVIVSAVRTPFDSFGGPMRSLRSIDLGAMVMKETLKRTRLDPLEIHEVYYGLSCLPEVAKELDVPARWATLLAGFPGESISVTLNRACCTSLTCLRLLYRSIKSGDIDVGLAVGADNMSHTPYIVSSEIRWGTRMQDIMMEDPLYELGFYDFNPVSMDASEVAVEHGITRRMQDEWAYGSNQKYARAFQEGKFKVGEELMAVEIPQKKGPPLIIDRDQHPRPDVTPEKLAKLPTIYGTPTVTAGNAPGLNGGATAILIMTRKKAKEKNLPILGEIVVSLTSATAARYIATIPAKCIKLALEKTGLTLDDIDLIEINEAFAAVVLTSTKILAEGDEKKWQKILAKTNVNGGAIAIGHPVGASALRITMTLMYELKRRGGGVGLAAICGGLAQGEAIIVRV
jgi:acetyl-CoA C-acetyltransferase